MKTNHKGHLTGDGNCGLIDGTGQRRGWPTTQVFCALCLIFAVALQAPAAPVYPLKTSANGRYLVDQNNVPVLITGDSPQALIVNLSEADANSYFADRSSNGFNTVWINLLCDTYTGGRPDGTATNGTLPGIPPFTNTLSSCTNTPDCYDLTTPNETYFAHVDRILSNAAQYGLLVMLDPIETGGWLNTMLNNGTANCRAYGQYLGNRYKNFDNILWINGNDYEQWSNTVVDTVVQQVALGIQDNDSRHLQTIELNYPVSSSLDDTNWIPIISVNSTYTYQPTYAQLLVDYNRANFLPNVMVEANYEFQDWINNATGRRQEYWSLLSGACGQLYGNHFTWQFLPNWADFLDTAGSTQIGYVKALFEPRRWYDLIPDQNHTLVTDGDGTFTSTGSVDDSDYATAARTADGSLAVVYLPTIRTITVDMTELAGPVTARWYDPSSGVYSAIPGSPFANAGSQTFTPTGNNADTNGDWVLVLENTLDTTPPNLTIAQPADFQRFSNSTINVTGTASDASGITGVTVNGAAATLAGSNWSEQVTLSPGTNLLTVIATDASAGANTATSTVHAIYQPLPAAFTLVSPADGASGVSLEPMLTWTPSSGDASFSVQVATTADFASPVFSQNGLLTTSASVTTGLSTNVTYYWRVTATNAGGSTVAGNAPFRFTTVPVTPVITCPPDVTVQCASEVPPPDFAGGSITWAGDVTNSMTCPNRFVVERTYSIAGATGDAATCIQNIAVIDDAAPAITGPANVTVNVDPGKCYASNVALGNAVAISGCGDSPTVVNNAPSQFPTGINRVIWMATDSCHNSSTCTQLVIVVDNQAPTITQCAPPLVASATTNGQVAVPVFTDSVVAVDNCTLANSLVITQDPAPGTLVGLGTNTVTITVTDAAGNASQCTTSLIVGQSVDQVALWEVAINGVPHATCVLQFASDMTVTGYGVEESLCGAFTVTGAWSQDQQGRISGTFDQTFFSNPNCQHGTIIDGTFAAKPSKSTRISATARDATGAFQWKAVQNPSFPVLVANWGGTLKIKNSKVAETYELTPEDSKPGLYDIRGQSADATYTLTGTLIVTSRDLVTAYIVRQFPTGPVGSFYSGKFNLSKQTLKLTGKDAAGMKHQLSVAAQ